MNRRDLIQKMLIGGTTLVIAPSILQSCSKDPDTDPDNGDNNNNNTGGTKITIDLTNPTYSALNTVGGFKIVQSIIVANTGSNTFVAVDSVCTHNGCTVEYSNSSSNFVCPCHGSAFSKTGSVVNGPATTSLKSYQVSKTGDIITITVS